MPPGLAALEEQQDPSPARVASMVALGAAPLRDYLERAFETSTGLVEAGGPEPSQLADLRLTVSLFERYSTNRPALHLIVREVQSLEPPLETLTKIHDALRRTRQDVAQETLTAIGQKVGEYYFAIHPPDATDESTGAPAVVIQRHGRGTAFVRGQFAQQEVRDPQWVYSDGHLDTVGICIFLALRRYRAGEDGDAKLLILDDIVVSIDLGHARRLIDLLRNEFDDHQILLFTHNGLFAHWCANLMPGLRRLEIKGWSLAEGPRIGDYAQSRDRLVESLGDAGAKEIALQLMWLMDEWLGEARFAFQVAVPAKPDERYTLTEIWEPFAKVVRRLGQRLASDLGGAVELVDELQDLPAIRNTLPAHENEFAREFPRAVMVEVAGSAIQLVACLYCEECRTFARPIPSRFDPSIVHCRCRGIQYVQPGGAGNPN